MKTDSVQFLQSISEELIKRHPEVLELFKQVDQGTLLEEDAWMQFAIILSEDEEFCSQYIEKSKPMLKELGLAKTNHKHTIVEKEVGLPQLNPLVTAAIGERLQFDGDIPELRTGPMDPDATPAVPVKTNTKNTSELGFLLDEASKKMAQVLEDHSKKLCSCIEKEVDLIGTDTTLVRSPKTTKLQHPELADPPEYRRGRIPTPLEVNEKFPQDLTRSQKQDYTWKFISTTQGRRSVCGIISQDLLKNVRDSGLEASSVSDVTNPHYQTSWKFDILGGTAVAEDFSFVDVVVAKFTKNLLSFMKREQRQKVEFLVTTLDNLARRHVGWELLVK